MQSAENEDATQKILDWTLGKKIRQKEKLQVYTTKKGAKHSKVLKSKQKCKKC